MKKPIAILGAGAWGTALAHFFATQGHQVFLWCHEEHVAQSINQEHKNNLFLNGVILSPKIYASTDISTIVRAGLAFIIEAIPVSYLTTVCNRITQTYALEHYWILTSKGLDPISGKHSLQLMQQLFGVDLKIGVLSGPTFASELVQGMPTAWTLATKNHTSFDLLLPYWQTKFTTVYFSDDSEGVSLCGALKNIVALLLGILDGAGYGKNTQAWILTHAYKEIKKLVVYCGGQEKTVDGLAGFGDLFLTASTNVSKNRTYGYLVGQKKTSNEIKKQLPVAPEGVTTAVGLHVLLCHIADHANKEFPLLDSVYHLLLGNQPIEDVVQKLLHT